MKTSVTKSIFDTLYQQYKTRRLKRFTNRLVNEITTSLAEEIRKSIDDEILKDIKKTMQVPEEKM